MTDLNKKLEDVVRVSRILSRENLFKIITICAIIVFLIFAWMFRYETSIEIIKKRETTATSVPVLYVSTRVKSEITTIVTKIDPILAIQIVTINFQKNIRIETFIFTDNVFLRNLYNRYINNKIIETPFFNENKINNGRILRLIGGEFVCIPYKDSTAYQYAPAGEKLITEVCAIGIPPIYGEFSGILTIYLSKTPDKDLREQLHWMARDIALKIYEDNKRRNENKK